MNKKIWTTLAIIVCSVYLIWRFFFTLPFQYGLVAAIGGIILFIAEFASMVEGLINLKYIGFSKKLEKPVVPHEYFPDVDVLIATHSESPDLLARTVNGCLHMNYPDPKKVHIYLCDDGNRPEILELAKTMDVGCFQLADNKEAKAGNLNNALRHTASPLIVTFDADMIPQPKFLMETVPYFFLPKMINEAGEWRFRTEEEIDPEYKMGFVQTPQNFYNPDLFQFNFGCEQTIPNEQDYFFKEVNVGRNNTNSPIYAGSNTMITRESLEAVGYIHTNNITEDFATGIDIQAHGFSCYAVDEVLASGLAPDDFAQLIQQRQRWGRGCVQTILSKDFLFSDLPFRTKMSYFNCLSYWWTFARRAVFILAPILFVLFDLVLIRASLLELLLIWAPSYLIFSYTIKMTSGKIRVTRWSNITDTILFPYLIFPIICETLGLSLRKFAVTDKSGHRKRSAHFYYAIPHIILFAGNTLALLIVLWNMFTTRSIGSIFVLFWLITNGYYLLMAILFMTGRVNLNETAVYNTPILMHFSSRYGEGYARTRTISESGFSFVVPDKTGLEKGKNLEFQLTDGSEQTTVPAEILSVTKDTDGWLIKTRIQKKDRQNYALWQMIYGHEPTLAKLVTSNRIEEVLSFIQTKTDFELPIKEKNEKERLDTRKFPTFLAGESEKYSFQKSK